MANSLEDEADRLIGAIHNFMLYRNGTWQDKKEAIKAADDGSLDELLSWFGLEDEDE